MDEHLAKPFNSAALQAILERFAGAASVGVTRTI
jgi:hypothetical protein